MIVWQNAAHSFRRYIKSILDDTDFYDYYIDDIVRHFYQSTKIRTLKNFVYIFKEFGIIINPNIYVLGENQILFLGHIISSEGIKTSSERVLFKIFLDWQQLHNYVAFLLWRNCIDDLFLMPQKHKRH